MTDSSNTKAGKTGHRQTAIITGAGTGIGAAVAVRLARAGFDIVAAYNSSAAGVERLGKQIAEVAPGITCIAQRTDISDPAAVKTLFAVCIENFGAVDAVINNAGIGHMAAFAEITDEDYQRIFNTNTYGTFNMCREAARQLADGGTIINISTGMTVSSAFGMALYTGSKLAVEGFTRTLAHELGPRGITVNTVSPGLTNTPMIASMSSQQIEQLGEKNCALRRLGEPEDVAAAVALLCMDEGRWITGQNIHADGGTIIQ